MAATLTDTADLVQWPAFQRKVAAAMVSAAVAVGNEAVSSPPTETQRRRHALSANVLREPGVWALNFAWAVAQNPVVNYSSSDNDIQFTVNSVWDAVAGVEPTA